MNENNTSSGEFSYLQRKIEHIAPIGFCLLLPYISLRTALILAAISIIYGLFISRLILPKTFRPGEQRSGFSAAKFFYAFIVMLLLIAFYQRLYIVAGAWAALAFGDAFAGLAGLRYGKKFLPFNRNKTWVGMIAFFTASLIGSVGLICWVGCGRYNGLGLSEALVLGAAGSAAGAIGESLSGPIDDNITCTIFAAGAIYLAAGAIGL